MTAHEPSGGGPNPASDAGPTTPGGGSATAQGGPARAQRRRPSAVTIVAVTYLVLSVAWAFMAIQALISAQLLLPPGGGVVDTESMRASLTVLGAVVAIRQAAVGVTAFVAGIALLRMHPRGWLLGMVAAVIVLAVQLVSWYDSTPSYILMAITVAVVLLMNQAEVRDAFDEEAKA